MFSQLSGHNNLAKTSELTDLIVRQVREESGDYQFLTQRIGSIYSNGQRILFRFPGVTRPRTQFIPPQPQETSRPRQPPFQPTSQQQSFSSQGGFQQQSRRPASSRPQVVDNEIFPGLTGHAPRDEVTLGTAANVAQFAVNNQNGAQVSYFN